MLRKILNGKQLAYVLIAAGLLLVGALGGILFGDSLKAFAAAKTSHVVTQQGDYCSLYEQTLADQLGISTASLERANSVALQTVIDQAAKDGTITARQKAQLEKRAKSADASGQFCAAIGKTVNGAGTAGLAMIKGARQAVATQVASTLKLPVKTLHADVIAGQSLQAIAQQQGVSITDLNTAYENAVQTQLAQAVKNGAITQSQSDTIFARIQAAVAQNHYPLFEAHARQSSGTSSATSQPTPSK